jgi:DNA-binding NarL/FixJ family response regulator
MTNSDSNYTRNGAQPQFFRYREKRALSARDPQFGENGGYAIAELTSRVATIEIIESRALLRGCLAASIAAQLDASVAAFETVDDWRARRVDATAALIIYSTSDIRSPTNPVDILAQVVALANGTPVFVASDCQDPKVIIEVLRQGARGYIPTTMALEVWIEAIRLVRAGGTFAPPSCLVGAATDENAASIHNTPPPSVSDRFTVRQAAVVEAIRRGKSNKAIAYELNMCESTVKVHVRNIMKRLKARNRTEIAFIVSEMLDGAGSSAAQTPVTID